MLAAEFDFDLPDDLIAQYPVEPREHSRLMVIHRATGRIEHHRFSELPAILDSQDILARNNSRVIPARLIGHRELTGGKWEGLFLREVGDGTWEVLASTRGRPSIGERVVVGTGLSLRLESRIGGRHLARATFAQGGHRPYCFGTGPPGTTRADSPASLHSQGKRSGRGPDPLSDDLRPPSRVRSPPPRRDCTSARRSSRT